MPLNVNEIWHLLGGDLNMRAHPHPYLNDTSTFYIDFEIQYGMNYIHIRVKSCNRFPYSACCYHIVRFQVSGGVLIA